MQLQLKKKRGGTLEIQTRSKTSSIKKSETSFFNRVSCSILLQEGNITISEGYCRQKADHSITQIPPTCACHREASSHLLTCCILCMLALMRTLSFSCELASSRGGYGQRHLGAYVTIELPFKALTVVSELGGWGRLCFKPQASLRFLMTCC